MVFCWYSSPGLSFMGKPFLPRFLAIFSLCFILEVFIQCFFSFLRQVLHVKGLQILNDDLVLDILDPIMLPGIKPKPNIENNKK